MQSQARKDKEQEEYKKKMNNYASRQAQAKYYYQLYKGDSCVKSVADLDCDLETLSLKQQRKNSSGGVWSKTIQA